MDLPYRAEYAKSGRSNCRGCRSPIAQGTLRIAVMVQSSVFDGKTPNWHHYMCFFSKQRPKTVDDIHHFESLRLADQNFIRERVGNAASVILPEKKTKGKKRDAAAAAAKKAALGDFRIEYAKSSRAVCRGCELKIMKDEVRISKKDYESEIGRKYGGQDLWHHLNCFAKIRAELGYFESAEKLPGFETLNSKDQADAKKQLPPVKQEDIPDTKKLKSDDTDDDAVDCIDGLSPKESNLYAKQNKTFFKFRDLLQKNLNKNELTELLVYNGQRVPQGVDRMLDRLADYMTYGALKTCNVCKNGQLVFDKFGYICRGNLTEWTKCNTLVKEPERIKFLVPKEFAEEYPFLKKYKCVIQNRVVKPSQSPDKVKKEGEVAEPKVKREAPPLYNMEFVILGKLKREKDELKKQITKLGGKVITKISGTVMAVIASEAEVEKMGARMSEVQTHRVHVVPEEFVDEAPKYVGKIPELITKITNCDWGSDPSLRLPPEPSSSKSGGSGAVKSRSIYTSSVPSKIKLKLKGGTAVDPDSGLEDVAHVYAESDHKDDKFTVVLSKTDVQSNKNSFYKLQLLQADKGHNFWVFRSWGRTGTTIGSNKLENFDSLHEAKKSFFTVYEEKTGGNMWENRSHFMKVPGAFYPVDVDYEDNDAGQNLAITDTESKLAQPVQNLIRLIFDINAMKKVMMEFELDTEKMPLGRLSKKQIQSAYSVLSELQRLIDRGDALDVHYVDASNRFYTFVPHSFGIDELPIIRDAEVIKQKLDMLDNLMELEIAYNLMKSSGSDHSVDNYYHQLNTEIDVLDKNSEEFKIIDEYVKNTHAETHSSYSLQITDVFKVVRKGEEKRFKPFKKLHNHKLLWHGSRTTNFAGIFAQGLRIAPPEAPVTGYMFGKGIYFADMVSKSANYCCTTPGSPTGLLLLCDVALGNMYERKQSDYIEKLPKGMHSCKGLGKTAPDPKVVKYIDGVEVPVGKGATVPKLNSALLYNEYIVYDVAQVNVKYLLRVDFKYKY